MLVVTGPDRIQSDEGTRVSPAGARRAGTSIWPAIALAIVLLVGAGEGYRAGARRLDLIFGNPVRLPLPLRAIPIQVGAWSGKEQALKTTTEEYMRANFADDYISRSYFNKDRRIPADLYVVFCSSRPAGLLGHKPDVCLPMNGYTLDKTTRTEVVTRTGQKIPCRIQQFHKRPPEYSERFVLSFYVVNGQITLSEEEFSSFWGRRPNLSGNLARYVAQVQVSALTADSACLAAADLVDEILTFLPDRHGRVKAASSSPGGL
jgi:hypothetical protein